MNDINPNQSHRSDESGQAEDQTAVPPGNADRARCNILFTSVGRRVELLRAFRAAYNQLQLAGNIVAIDASSTAPGLRIADRAHIVPRLDDDKFLPALKETIERERIAAVFPLIDPDVVLLAEHKQELESCGTRVAVVDPRAARVTGDKLLTQRFFHHAGLPTPGTWLPRDIVSGDLTYPVIVKPRAGSASHHVFKVENERQLDFFVDYVDDPVVQEWVPGPEITNDVVCDWHGQLLSVVSRQRIRVHGGEVLIGKTIRDQRILDDCAKIARVLPAVGPITVQCMISDRGHLFTEINARFGGGAPLGFAAGVNSPQYLLASLAGRHAERPALGDYQTELYMTRYMESLFLSELNRAEPEGHCF